MKNIRSIDVQGEANTRGLVLALTTLLLTAASTAEPVQAMPLKAAVTVMATDTVPATAPRLFERRVFFSPEYLRRAVEAASKGASEQEAVELEKSSMESLAATYARRYGISVDLSRQIIESALKEGVDPELGFRIIRVESVFKPNARGPGGSLGLTQLMPSTARAIDRSLRTDAQILDPVTNLRTGFRYLRAMIERYDGNVRLGVLAYNRGEGTVDRAIRAGRDPENGYSPKVLGSESNRYSGKGIVSRAGAD